MLWNTLLLCSHLLNTLFWSSGVKNKEKLKLKTETKMWSRPGMYKLIKLHVSGTRLVHIRRPKCGQDQGSTNPGRQTARLNKFISKTRNIPRLPVWNSFHTKVLASKILKICVPQVKIQSPGPSKQSYSQPLSPKCCEYCFYIVFTRWFGISAGSRGFRVWYFIVRMLQDCVSFMEASPRHAQSDEYVIKRCCLICERIMTYFTEKN